MIWGEARQPAAKARTMIRFYPKEKRHFRGHKTSVHGKWIMHPSYIVGEEGPYFYSFGITHSNKKGKGHNNHLLAKIPSSVGMKTPTCENNWCAIGKTSTRNAS